MATTEPEFCALKHTQTGVTGAPNAVLEKIHEWKGMGENLLNSLAECFSDIQSREQSLRLDRESLEKRKKDLEERERKFDLFVEEKNAGLMLREENLDEQLKLVREHIDRLEASQGLTEGFGNRKYCEKLKEIEDREREIDAVCRSIEKRLRDVEKKEKEFDKLCNGKMRELDLDREILSKEKKQFAEDVRLVNEELKKKQKMGCDLIERLESAVKLLERVKVGLDERFKDMEIWEAAAQQSLTDRLGDAELIKESLEKRFQEIEKIEQEFNVFLEGRTRELESKEQELRAMRIESKDEQLSDEHKLGHQILESEKLKETESVDVSPKDAELSTESSNNQDLKQKMLNLLINRTEKDLELMDDEIFKVLLLSSDPGKFVLDAVVGLYSSKLGNGSEESKVRRFCILLLYQLTKMSPNIQPCVREEALKLALIWMSYLNTAPENPLEVLMLLHLLAAYNLSSQFDKTQLFSFVKSVVQHKRTPALCHILGLADIMPDIIQNLIHEKQYLLASSYIYEFGLDHVFPQSAVLEYYVMQAKLSAVLSAKEKCRREQKPFEPQVKAEIADLRVAIEHIIKYGLESEYSLDLLRERIKELERNTSPLSSWDFQKQGKGKRRWDVQQKQHNEHWSSSQWKAQNWHRRDQHPSTSSVGFHKQEGPVTHLNRFQKKRRKRYYDSKAVRSSFDHQ